MKTVIIVFCLLVSSLIYSQNNITNTLGTSGTFTIKDGSTTFFTLSQSDGHITLPETTSPSLGVIYKGASSFIHDFRPTGAPGNNTFFGSSAGNFTMSYTGGDDASANTGVGFASLTSLTTGYFNTAMGSYSLVSNTSGYQNTALGNAALYFNMTGYRNTASGAFSLYTNSTGFDNTASGYYSLHINGTGSGNTASGAYSLYSNTTGNSNTASGHYSLYFNTTGIYNTASGSSSLYFNTIGNSNTASGSYSLHRNTTGDENTAAGYGSLSANTTGANNTAFGHNSLRLNTTGFHNTAVGHHSLENNTGNYNTALGFNAGSTVTSGANLTLLGIDAHPSSPTALNQVTLGNAFVTSLRCNVQNISSLSDARDKKSIKDLNLGIDFLMKLKPRIYNWDKREWYADNKSDGSKMKEEPSAGFIAQELDEVQTKENAEWLNLVLKDNPEKLEATPANLLPIIVKAIQDLKKENDELKRNNTELVSRLNRFEQMQNILFAEMDKLKTNSNEITKVSLGKK